MTDIEEFDYVDPNELDDYDDVDSTTVDLSSDTYEPPADTGEGCE
jgi:hypothetical protein